jgi:crotonobetainyl-CoA:carnitine CoA-transferase CaiB-like acyl-CoA transferase
LSFLRGLRVVEAGDLSVAYCGRLLADMGADVVTLGRAALPADDEQRPCGGALADFYDAGKRAADVATLAAPAAAALLAAADVLLLAGGPRRLRRLGVDCDRLRSAYPRLVVAVVAPFGSTGPRCDWRAANLIAAAAGGMLAVNGWPGAEPLQSLGTQAYHAAGLHAAIGIVLALLRRVASERGELVEVSLQESVIASLEHVTGLFHATGEVAARRGTRHWTGTFDVAGCRDGAVALSHLGDWTALVEWLAADGCAEDLGAARWCDAEQRRAGADHVFAVLRRWAKTQAVDELVAAAQLRRLPFAPVWSLRQTAAHPQLRARGFFRRDASGRDCLPGPPFRIAAASGAGNAPACVVAAPVASSGGSCAAADLPLHGVRVLDLTWVVAGPVATRMLADAGAEVIKVERLDTPADAARRGGHFGNLNRGKRSLALDLSRAEGLEVLRELVRRCDVLVENFSPRVLPNWGLDDTALQTLRPDLIAVHMSGFGRDGPYCDWVSYGPTLQAQTGYTACMRGAQGGPAGWSFSYSDMVAGYSAALAVLLALWRRRRVGVGSIVDLAQLEALAALVGPALHAAARGDAAEIGPVNRSQEGPAAPHGVYRCAPAEADRWCAIAVFGETQWRRFAAVVAAPWTGDRCFATERDRLASLDELDCRVGEWTARHSAEQVAERLQAAGIAAAVVADARDLCARDPHLAARGFWRTLRTPEAVAVVVDGNPIRLAGEPLHPRAPGPLLGEHGAAILRDVVELSPQRIDFLRAAGIIRCL